MRVSTVVLIVAFLALFWVHETFQPQPVSTEAPSPQVVPPGFVPDPSYTWVPRTQVRRPKEPVITTTTPTTTSPTTTTETTPTETTSPTSPTTPTPSTTVVDPDGAGPLGPLTITPPTLPTIPGLAPTPTPTTTVPPA